MIRGGDPQGIVPREKPDDRGLSEAMTRADERDAAEALAAIGAEKRLRKATRALFVDALYRAKLLNGDAAFDIDDIDDLDAVEGMAERIAARRGDRREAAR